MLTFTLKSSFAIFITIATILFLGMLGGLLGNYLTDFIKYTFFNETQNWLQFKFFVLMILIIVGIFPLTFYLVKKLYNLAKKLKVWPMNVYKCLKGECKK